MIKLNVGCGTDIKEGYVNIDVRKTHPSVKIADVCKLPYKNGTVDEIVAKDVFEHISFHDTQKLLKHWVSKLKKGGKLFIKCPSINMIAKTIIKNNNNLEEMEDMIRRIFGGQNYPENTHLTIGHPKLMRKYLKGLGIKHKNIKIQNGGFGNGTNMKVWVVK